MQETIIEDEETYDFIIEESKNMIRKQMISENLKKQEENAQEKEEEHQLETNNVLPSWASVEDSMDELVFSQEKLQDFEFVKNHFFVVDPNTTTDAQQIQGNV